MCVVLAAGRAHEGAANVASRKESCPPSPGAAAALAMACKSHAHGATTHAACVLPAAHSGSADESHDKDDNTTRAAARVATGASDGSVCVWDTKSGHCLWREVINARDAGEASDHDLSPSAADVRALLPLAPTRLAVACWDGRLVWLTVCHHDGTDGGGGGSGGGQSSVVACASGPLWCLAALPEHADGNRAAVLASGGADGVVRLWQCPSHDGEAALLSPCLELKGHTEDVTCICATSSWMERQAAAAGSSNDDVILASGSTDGWVRLWRVSRHAHNSHHKHEPGSGGSDMAGTCLRQLRGGGDRHGGTWAPLSVTGLAWLHCKGNHPRLVSGTSEGTLVLWGHLTSHEAGSEHAASGSDEAAPPSDVAPQQHNPMDVFGPLLFAPLRAALGAIPGVDGDALPLPLGDDAKLAHVASICDMSRGRQTLRLSGTGMAASASAPDTHALPQHVGRSSSSSGVQGVTSLSTLPRHSDTLCCGDGGGTVRLWRAVAGGDGTLRLAKVCAIAAASPKGAAGVVVPLGRHRIVVAGGSQLRVWQLQDGQETCETGHSVWICDDV